MHDLEELLEFRDWGKMAATFVDVESGRAVRLAARELHPEIESKNHRQMLVYRELSDHAMFTEEWVKVALDPKEFPGYQSARIACVERGEGINFSRFSCLFLH